MTADHTFPATSWPLKLFWLGLAVFWSVRIVQHGIVWYQHAPAPPWDQPVAGVLTSGGSLLLAVSFLVRRTTPRIALVGASIVLIVIQSALFGL